jgi:YtkA-like
VRVEHAPGERDLTHLRAVPARRLPAVAALTAVVVSCALLSACRRPEQQAADLRVDWRVSPAPPRVGPARVELDVLDASGRRIPAARLRLEGHMTHPGMAPVVADVRERPAGGYEADLSFSMAGDWVLLVTGDLPDGRRLRRQFDVPGVQQVQ